MGEIIIPPTIIEALAMLDEADELHVRADALTAAAVGALPTLRAHAGVSQTMLASAVGISQPRLSQIESLTGIISTETPTARHIVKTLHDLHDARDDLARARGDT